MTLARKSALWVAALFIMATVTSVGALILLDPITSNADPVAALVAGRMAVVVAVVLMFASAAAIIAIPVAFFPVLGRFSETGALLYFSARIFESVTYVIGGVFTLAMLNVAQTADAGAISHLQALADVAFATGPTLFFALGALVLAVLLWRSRLVPRWLSGWKAVGGALMVLQGVLTLYGPLSQGTEMLLFMPIAVNEMVFALWLIFKGFDQDALARLGP